MANNDVSVQEIKQLVNDVDANNAESVNKFLTAVDEKFKGIPAADRADELDLLSNQLEQKGVLPQLLVTAGMGDAYSSNYQQMKENNGWDLKKDDLENMAKNGKKGFVNVDAAGQFLASAILRNMDGLAGISQESSHHTFGIKDNRVDYQQIKSWASRENKELKDRRGVENALLQWDSIAKKLETDNPKRDDVQALLKADKFSGNKMLTAKEREAAQFMLDKFDTIRSIDNSSFRPYSYDDWISKGKLEYWGKEHLHTSEQAAKNKQKNADLIKKAEADEAAKAKEKPQETQETKAETDRIKQLEEQLKKQQELIEKLIKEKTEAKPPKVETTMPPAEAETTTPPAEGETTTPPAEAETKPPTEETQPPKVEQPTRDWSKEEEENRRILQELINATPRTNEPVPPVRR